MCRLAGAASWLGLHSSGLERANVLRSWNQGAPGTLLLAFVGIPLAPGCRARSGCQGFFLLGELRRQPEPLEQDQPWRRWA